MKANEFVKKFGWDRAKQHIEAMDIQNWHNDFYNNLKRLVESYELVEKFGGLNGARKELANLCDNLVDCAYLCQAIADVEACKEVS